MTESLNLRPSMLTLGPLIFRSVSILINSVISVWLIAFKPESVLLLEGYEWYLQLFMITHIAFAFLLACVVPFSYKCYKGAFKNVLGTDFNQSENSIFSSHCRSLATDRLQRAWLTGCLTNHKAVFAILPDKQTWQACRLTLMDLNLTNVVYWHLSTVEIK